MLYQQRNLSATFRVDKEKNIATHAVKKLLHNTDNMGFSMNPDRH
jgi:hypothetical protein